MIKQIHFGILTAEEIREQSVVHVTEKKTFQDGAFLTNGLRDSRLKLAFGHIDLHTPVYHISFVNNIVQWLRCICYKCGSTLVKNEPTNIQKNKWLQYMAKHAQNKCPECHEKQPKYSWNKDKAQIEKSKALYDIDDVRTHLCQLDESFLSKVDMSHPKHMILRCLPIPPTSVRPAIMQGGVIRGEDDLTYRLIQIMRSNDKVQKTIIDKRPEHIIHSAKESLQNAVTGYINHAKVGGKRKVSKREYTSLTARLKTKEGRIRGNLMGKRVDFTSRSVITGDDTLGMHEIGIPISVAKKLTVPLKVTAYNKSIIQDWLTKKDSTIKFVIRPNGSRVDLSFVNRTNIDVDVGWSVERELMDGDIVLFNRQPSLHKMSIMAHEVKILPYSTFRMNLSCTTPYNADFDGDEMNVHVPQTLEAQAEARNIMAVQYQLVSPQANKPVMGVIQDTMVGAYLLSANDVSFTKEEMMQCVFAIKNWDGIFKHQKKYTGKDLITYVLPYIHYNNKGVVIEKGKFLKGRFTKKILGRGDGSLIHVMYNELGPKTTIEFINRLQCIVHKFLSIQGFSVGISDMLSDVNVESEMEKAFDEISLDSNATEAKINQRLNICRDTMATMVQTPLNDSNRLYTMVHSGSKGSSINVSQIMAVVGQQNLCGKRIPKTWTDRTLPHFEKHSNGPKERGFITHSYVQGLEPHEVWMHAISGREGLIDTAIKTSQTGYIQRRFMKALENIKIQWDGSARNADGSIIQFQYGDDGFDSMRVCNQYIDTWDMSIATKYDLMDDYAFLHDLNKWRDDGSKDTGMFMLPVPVKRYIDNALLNCPKRKKIGVRKVKELIDTLLKEIDNQMLQILIRAKLNPYRVVKELKLSHVAMDDVLAHIRSEYAIINAIAGESVGALAAQSIGEPATQMTLNTFHFAGVSSMNVTLGVPRLEELINCTKSDRMKTPSTILQTDDADKLVKRLRHIRFEDLVEKMYITRSPNKEEVKWYHLFPDENYHPYDPSKETIVVHLKEWYDMVSVKECLNQVYIEYTDGPHAIIHIQLPTDEDVGVYYENYIRKQTVRGIEHAEETMKVKLPGKSKYHVETSLSNLKKLIELEGVDFSTINTNDIHMVKNMYGIEAARASLIREIRKILSYYGIYVNVRHITLAVDWITWIGALTPLTRHGIRLVDTSPLKRSTFEEVVEVFNQAACAKEIDLLQGISECIITGTPPNLGTNVVGTVVDKGMIEQYKVPFPVEEFKEMVAEDDFDEIYGSLNEVDPWADERSAWEKPPMLQPTQPLTFSMQPLQFSQPTFQQFPSQNVMFPQATQNVMFPQATQNVMFPQAQTQNVMFPQAQTQNVMFPQAQLTIKRPVSPCSPAYSPHSPTSPAYSPTSPAYSPQTPTSPAYSPTSPVYSPTSPVYSPTSPAYSPHTPTSPAYSPTSPAYSPTSPAYDPMDNVSDPFEPQSPGYDPFDPVSDPVLASPQKKRRKTYC